VPARRRPSSLSFFLGPALGFVLDGDFLGFVLSKLHTRAPSLHDICRSSATPRVVVLVARVMWAGWVSEGPNSVKRRKPPPLLTPMY
jgi:hypothetical protein